MEIIPPIANSIEAVPVVITVPCANTRQSIFHEAHDKIEDCLLRDLLSRKPGEICGGMAPSQLWPK
jgi:hypothetical protein